MWPGGRSRWQCRRGTVQQSPTPRSRQTPAWRQGAKVRAVLNAGPVQLTRLAAGCCCPAFRTSSCAPPASCRARGRNTRACFACHINAQATPIARAKPRTLDLGRAHCGRSRVPTRPHARIRRKTAGSRELSGVLAGFRRIQLCPATGAGHGTADDLSTVRPSVAKLGSEARNGVFRRWSGTEDFCLAARVGHVPAGAKPGRHGSHVPHTRAGLS